jgi:hypothetical protein
VVPQDEELCGILIACGHVRVIADPDPTWLVIMDSDSNLNLQVVSDLDPDPCPRYCLEILVPI